MMNLRMFLVVAAAVVAGIGFAAGCASATAVKAADPGEVLAQAWMLTELEGTAVEVEERNRPTLRFDAAAKRAAGFAGVNRFSGSFTMDGTSLKFGPVMATKMAGTPEQNEIEMKYLRALEATTGWQLVDGGLELHAGGSVRARMERWTVDELKAET